jgi:hypothetical protein
MARQRIVPAIPHQLTIRRAKVVPAGKNDQQLAGDKGKNAPLSASADKPDVSTRVDAIEDANAHPRDESVIVINGAKDEQAKQLAAEEEPVAIKELAVNKEASEEKQLVENKEELPVKKDVTEEKKEANGELSIVPSSCHTRY